MRGCIAIEGKCGKKIVARDLCRNHYDEMVELGRFGNREMCSVNGCRKRSIVRGMCRYHYQDARRKGELKPKTCKTCWFPVVGSSDYCEEHVSKVCRVEGCFEKVRAKKLCNVHYQQDRRGSLNE